MLFPKKGEAEVPVHSDPTLQPEVDEAPMPESDGEADSEDGEGPDRKRPDA
jgi:hypothetical protein